VTTLSQAVALYQEAGDLRGEARAWTHLGNALAILRDLAGADHAFDRGLALARQSGELWYEAFALYLSGWTATVEGDLTAAEDRVGRSSALFEQLGDSRGAGYAVAVLAHCAIRNGRAEDAVRMLRESLSVFEDLPDRWGLLYATSLMAAACAALTDWPLVATLLGIMDSLSERVGGQLFPHQLAEIDTIATAAARALGPAMAARSRAGHAIGRGDGITGVLWPSAHTPTTPDGQASTAVVGPALTPREREVAQLITTGLTNRQIGVRLFIAERTVDAHVSRILAKLGCASRAQVAAMVAAAGGSPGTRQ
jgi:DNA-binding CsgD family transcriptional regulator